MRINSLVFLFLLQINGVTSFVCPEHRSFVRTPQLEAKKAKKSKKSSSAGGNSGGIRGFGGAATASKPGNTSSASIDRSSQTRQFYNFIENYNSVAAANLKRVAIGTFPLELDNNETVQIRGVVALKNIQKGEVILSIPYELALNLGLEGRDPSLPAYTLLQEICKYSSENKQQLPSSSLDYSPYIAMLPTFEGSDMLGSTDFWSDEALRALQSPRIVDETLNRRKLVELRYERDVEPFVKEGSGVVSNSSFRLNGEAVTSRHLQWASWLITSRVLTVQNSVGQAYRIMIPLLDMCNHDRNSPHVLTGLAEPGGQLKVVSGADIQAGEQINICYGGGIAGNDRFIQDYGFLDGPEAFDIVARQLKGLQRLENGSKMSFSDIDNELCALKNTSIEDDLQILANGENIDPDIRTAIQFRIGVKKAYGEI